MRIIACLTVSLLFGLFSNAYSKNLSLQSPNKKVRIDIINQGNIGNIKVTYLGNVLIKQSTFGIQVNAEDYTRDVNYKIMSKSKFDETWKTINGKELTVQNLYNEFVLKVSKVSNPLRFHEIVFRLYNDGFAYRYNFPEDAVTGKMLIEKELTNLAFNNDFTYWAYNEERHNLGPVRRSEKNINDVKIPAVIEHTNSFIAIHEAEIIGFAPFTLNASSENQTIGFNTSYSEREKPFKTSWRAFMLGEKIGDLVESNLLVNLNEPCKIEDPSWIKPGKSLWDWRVWGYKAPDGFEYGLNTDSHIRMIDFASKNNIQNLLIDADWYGPEFSNTSDPTSSKEGIDIERCMAHAKSKNVGIILYLNDVGAKSFGLERVLKQFSDWGAVGIKYGFMQGSPEEKVLQTRKVVELCAKYKLMVDFHDGPIPPSGDRRTWPNMVTKEFGHAQADALRSHFPETSVNQVMINMIAGPLDLTNGWFDLNNAYKEKRPKVFQELPGTVVAEVAKLITIYTGLMVLPDSPEEYLEKDDLFDCIRKMPPQFDGLKVLDAKLDEYVCIARKSGNDWFIGTLTNRESRTITIDFNYLPKDREYRATLYEDAEDSHFQNNKESYTIRNIDVNSATRLSIKLAPGGGHAIFLKDMTEHID